MEYVYYKRKHDREAGVLPVRRAPGIYSEHVQGLDASYGTAPQSAV